MMSRSDDFRLISFNIQHRRNEPLKAFRSRMAATAEFLTSFSPDLICLQEVTPEAKDILEHRLQSRAAEYTPRNGSGQNGEGVPIFLLNPSCVLRSQHSFWFSETPEKPTIAWKAAHPRVCSVMELSSPFEADGNRSLWIYNLHLDHRSWIARYQSLALLRRRICQQIRTGDSILVCGDFNMSPYQKGFRDSMRQKPVLQDSAFPHPIGMARPTFLGWGPFRIFKARIDLCLHSTSLVCRDYHAHTPDWNHQRISDHRALEVRLSSVS